MKNALSPLPWRNSSCSPATRSHHRPGRDRRSGRAPGARAITVVPMRVLHDYVAAARLKVGLENPPRAETAATDVLPWSASLLRSTLPLAVGDWLAAAPALVAASQLTTRLLQIENRRPRSWAPCARWSTPAVFVSASSSRRGGGRWCHVMVRLLWLLHLSSYAFIHRDSARPRSDSARLRPDSALLGPDFFSAGGGGRERGRRGGGGGSAIPH